MFKDVGIDFFFQVDGGRVWAGSEGGEGGDEHIWDSFGRSWLI